MKRIPLAIVGVLIVAAVVARAQNPTPSATDPPKAPAGWKYVTSADGTYRFLFPVQSVRSGSRQRTFTVSGLTGRTQINYCSLKDGTTLLAEATNLSGRALKGLKINDVYNIMIDLAKKDGGTVSEPQPYTAGNLKGKEIIITKGGLTQREILVVVKGRIYSLSISAPDVAQTGSAVADTFLNSFTALPKTGAVPKDSTKDTPK